MNLRISAFLFSSLFLTSFNSFANTLSLSEVPLYLGGAIKPNIMVMMDNSGSMKIPMYRAPSGSWRGSIRTNFDPSTNYYGMFEASKNYQYDPTIAVNTAAYSVAVDVSKTGAFYQSTCLPTAIDVTCWSGRYLNWLTTRRIDASRQVLVGGKVESRTAFAYGSGYNYKIVANNEFADYDFGGQLANSNVYSPIPNDSVVMVSSPAHQNNGAQMALYDPYAKLSVGSSHSGLIFNAANNQIGEFGKASIKPNVDASKFLTAAAWTTVSFSKNYGSAPVVIAKPATYVGGDPALIRIKDVTATGFKITLQEWPYRDGNHSTEQASYVVVEAGSHTLVGSTRLDAGTISSNDEYADKGVKSGSCIAKVTQTDSDTVSFGAFSSSPVVVASAMTYNNFDAVNARAFSITPSAFDLALQQQQAVDSTSPVLPLVSETIGYIAVDSGSLTDAANGWRLEAGTQSGVDEADETIGFAAGFFSGEPTFLAGMNSMSDEDPAVLRLKSLTSSNATLFVEEEKSCDNELNHANETVGYITLQGEASEINLALVSVDEPTGLLQELASNVRLGVSFYRYPPNKADIYNSVTTDGGTMNFNIPNNPFVKKPSDVTGGGYRNLTGYITTPIDDIVDSLESYPLIWGTTPLAENLWEVVQYFKQEVPSYAAVATGFNDFDLADAAHPERDPYYYQEQGETLWCGKSSVIIVTDGEPYRDDALPGFDIGDAPGAGNGHKLDDVAYWGFCETPGDSCLNDAGKATEGTKDLRSDLTGPIASDKGQYLHVHTVGFAGNTIREILQATADKAGGSAYAAEDGAALESALKEVFQDANGASSASAVALNSGSISSDSIVYQARFDSEDWSGQLLAFPVFGDDLTTTGTDEEGSISSTAALDAATLIPIPSSRIIVTSNGASTATGRAFRWTGSAATGLSDAQKALLNNDVDVLNFLRGDQSSEGSNGGGFRDRSTLLGDIIHSSPTYIGPPNARYADNWGSGAAENAALYSSFKSANSSRKPLIYVGANDGMYHAFDAATLVEKFAFVPNSIFDRLNSLSDPNYSHQYTVDGNTSVIDAFYDGAWHTALVAGLGAGGQGMFALEVTDPETGFVNESTGAGQVLFEFTDVNDADLGYTYGQPSIVRLNNGKWAAIFGNGYNNTKVDAATSPTGNAVIYIVDLEDGSLISKFDTGVGMAQDPNQDTVTGLRPNGISTPSVVDLDGNNTADAVYAGDLFGNVWKIDLSGADASTWKFAFNPSLAVNSTTEKTPLFTACAGTTACNASNIQAITTQLQIVRHPTLPGFLVLFGTGKYFEFGDNSPINQVTQSFYGIWDKAEATLSAIARSNLLQQSITQEVTEFSYEIRVTTDNNIDWASNSGWYIDLISTEGGNADNFGERQVSNAVVRNGRIIFTTLLPSGDPCSFGGTGWLMELNVNSGARLTYTPFDFNGDGLFNSLDYVTIPGDANGDGIIESGEVITIPVSGKKSQVGIIATPSIVNSEDGQREFKYTSGSSGAIEVTTENPGPNFSGRQSWRQLDFSQ